MFEGSLFKRHIQMNVSVCVCIFLSVLINRGQLCPSVNIEQCLETISETQRWHVMSSGWRSHKYC